MEINLKDLTKKVLLQWRLIVIGVLILAVALTVFGAVQSRTAADKAEAKLEQQVADGVPEAERVVVPKVTVVSPKMLLLGAVLGFLAAGLGSALADLFSGYVVYAPVTFVIKGLMAFIAFYGFKEMYE